MIDNLLLLYVDCVLFEQVFFNLLCNVIEVNCEVYFGLLLWVVIGSCVEFGGLFCLWVCDQGLGVLVDQLEYIFMLFYISKLEGLGLGLLMSCSIVEGFGGIFEVELLVDGGLFMNCWLLFVVGVMGG